jgi:FAD:protein FMN transferase
MGVRMSAMLRRTAVGLGVAGGLLGWRLLPKARGGAVLRVSRPLMGTQWTIEVCDEGRSREAGEAVTLAFEELVRIDALMSEWKADSPVSRINAEAGRAAVAVPDELVRLIERSIGYSEVTGGAFDITWRGMGKIWKFDDTFRPPTAEAVSAARRNVNYREIQIDGNRVMLPRVGMSIGLGGIAKGYAVDRAMGVLAACGFRNALVNGGGDVRVSGTRNGEPWRLGVQHPRRAHGELIGRVMPVDQALASSGDYERFRSVDGVRYHHIIDVRTGWPAKDSMAATVLAPTAEQGVVLGKGVFILGAQEGIRLARQQGVDALLVDCAGALHMTDGFKTAIEMRGGTL